MNLVVFCKMYHEFIRLVEEQLILLYEERVSLMSVTRSQFIQLRVVIIEIYNDSLKCWK